MRNILINGAPGTGKTIISRAIPYYIGHEGLDIEQVYTKDIMSDIADIEKYAESEFVEYIQIHPSMTYEDIVYGIEVSANNNISMHYAGKRVKELCDRAIGRTEKFFVILDDIGRTNAGALLGNLLYAMEYRNQQVVLMDGTSMMVPDNVIFIVNECRTLYGTPLEYAIRRRFDYEKELFSDADVIDRYYTNYLSDGARKVVLDVFESVCNFVNRYILNDVSVQRDNYIPGHGMLMVDRAGTDNDILRKISDKIKYQLMPYIKDMVMSGILECSIDDVDNMFNSIELQLNAGQTADITTSTVSKIFCKTLSATPEFSLQDSNNHYRNVVDTGDPKKDCKEHRAIIENIVDAIFTNGVFDAKKALSGILLNTNVVCFEHRTRPGIYAAFLVEMSQNENYGYLATSSTRVRSYYSSNPCKTGRWAAYNDAPAYQVTFPDGTVRRYIALNAFRNAGFNTNTKVIHAKENTASIYCALYHLVKTYLSFYETNLSLLIANDSSYEDLYKLVGFEREYWDKVNEKAQKEKGTDKRLDLLAKSVLKLKTLWTEEGCSVLVDEAKYNSMAAGITSVSQTAYEELYNITGYPKSIEIKGVGQMVDLNDYQHIMESIGVRQMIFQGPPGTSKTYESKKFVLKQLKPDSTVFDGSNATQELISEELEPYKLTAADYADPLNSPKLTTGGWDLVQFHPSYGYEDFIRGIEVKPVNGQPVYSAVDRILGKIAEFSQIAENAAAQGQSVPKFYLVVDEINRANLATVFGELIYGLEYRNSKVSTPYEVFDRSINGISKDIVLGKNLFIIGTMNTADKSIDSIDYAIRRRFIFIDSPARRDVVISCYQSVMNVTDENSIEALLFDAVGYIFEGTRFFNEEYQRNDVRIGHTYFLRNSATGYIETMAEKFVFQVVPILREYIKDGIIDSYEDLKSNEHSSTDIANASSEDRIELVAENIMLYVKCFGENTAEGVRIDNAYIADFIATLCNALGY